MVEPENGRASIERSGFSYLPGFISLAEGEKLIKYFGSLYPLWEERHQDDQSARGGKGSRRLTRPVYWLGAWQFASLGYYAEPHYRENRCLRAEGFPPVMDQILQRLLPHLAQHRESSTDFSGNAESLLPNTCLMNYYGREVGKGVPRDYARLRMHRDGEPGPVIMFNIGQAGLLEFLDPERDAEVELGLWTRHRSVTILSGAEYKDRLYHRVSRVRTGDKPFMHTQLEHFELRRVSVSFRHVPEELIAQWRDLPAASRAQVHPYMTQLAAHSSHFSQQLKSLDESLG